MSVYIINNRGASIWAKSTTLADAQALIGQMSGHAASEIEWIETDRRGGDYSAYAVNDPSLTDIPEVEAAGELLGHYVMRLPDAA